MPGDFYSVDRGMRHQQRKFFKVVRQKLNFPEAKRVLKMEEVGRKIKCSMRMKLKPSQGI